MSNVYSDEYVETIKNLKRLQMIASGKAVESENPVIIEIPYDPAKEKASKQIGIKEDLSEVAVDLQASGAK